MYALELSLNKRKLILVKRSPTGLNLPGLSDIDLNHDKSLFDVNENNLIKDKSSDGPKPPLITYGE